MDIAAWLRGLGLALVRAGVWRQRDRCRAAADADGGGSERQMGVAVVGHRRKLLNAIGDLREGAAATAAPMSTAQPGATPPGATRRDWRPSGGS